MINFNKKFLSLVIFFIITFIFILLNILIGTHDIEDYWTGVFSSKFYFSSINNWFKSYYDLLGPGMKMPIGHGHFFYPTSLFLFFSNYKIFLFSTIFFNLLLQVYYFNKILKIFQSTYYSYLNSIFIVFAIPNFASLFLNDWISAFTAYSLSFPIIYYLIKIKKNYKNFAKFIICASIITLNCPLTYVIMLLHFILIFGVINNLFFLFKKKFFYLITILLILICFEYIYYIYLQYIDHSVLNYSHKPQESYSPNLFNIIIFHLFPLWKLLEFFTDFEKGYVFKGSSPFLGMFVFFAIMQSFKIFFQKKSNKYYYLNYLLIIFIIFAFTPKNYFINLYPGSWVFRDIVSILSLLFFIVFINDFKNYFKYISNLKFLYKPLFIMIILLSILTSFLMAYNYYQIVSKSISNGYTSFITIKDEDPLLKIFKTLDKTTNLQRIYLGPKIFNDMRSQFRNTKYNKLINTNIRDTKDFIDLGLAPFNIISKNSSSNNLRKPDKQLMHMIINPLNEELQNTHFVSLFRIKYILIYKSSYDNLEINNFNIIHEINLDEEILYLLKNKNFNKKIILQEYDLNLTYDCPKLENISCILSKYKNNLQFTEKINLERISINTYKLVNNSNENYRVLLPFIFDKNWRVKNQNKNIIGDINNSLMFLNIKSDQEVIIFYRDYLRFFMKIIMLVCFLLLLIVVIKTKKY